MMMITRQRVHSARRVDTCKVRRKNRWMAKGGRWKVEGGKREGGGCRCRCRCVQLEGLRRCGSSVALSINKNETSLLGKRHPGVLRCGQPQSAHESLLAQNQRATSARRGRVNV